jgi:hypothetical protein
MAGILILWPGFGIETLPLSKLLKLLVIGGTVGLLRVVLVVLGM